MWEKRTLWEFATRVPMVVHVPWLPQSHGQRTSRIVELIDVFPTLSDIAELPAPGSGDTFPVEGKSFADVIRNPSVNGTGNVALSTYPRCPTPGGPDYVHDSCIHIVERTEFPFMGYSLRTDTWRYTEFVAWNQTTLTPEWDHVHSREIYFHGNDSATGWDRDDDYEDINLLDSVSPSVLSELAAKLREVANAQSWQ